MVKKEINSGKNIAEPYDLMWHSSPYGPYFGDIGLGIGLVKVAGNSSMGIPLCPAFIRLDPEQDRKLIKWKKDSGNQSTPGVFPNVAISPELKLLRREWTPTFLKSFYNYKNVDIAQYTVVSCGGVHCRIRAEKPVAMQMQGISFGACKVQRISDGLHVVENHPNALPREYTIRFTEKPAIVVCGGDPLPGDEVKCFSDKTGWCFEWDKPIGIIEISVDTQRSFSPETGQLADLSKDGSARISSLKNKSFSAHLKEQAKSWADFFAKDVPVIECPDSRINQLNRYLAWVYRSNTIQHGGILPYPYSIPKQTFVGWWMWDTAKSAIAGAWYGRREVAWGGLLNIENLQYPAPHSDEGVVPNSARYFGVDCWYSGKADSNRFSCIPKDIPKEHGSGTHPPMLSLAMWSLWSVDGNNQLMQRILPNALAYDNYFERTRASRQVPGLLLVNRWSDSGMDNSKRWGNQNNRCLRGARHYDNIDWEMPVISVDVNVYDITEKICLAKMCRAVGLSAEADRLDGEAQKREEILHRELWDAARGSYFDRAEADGRFTPIITPTNLSPLMLKNLPQDRVKPLLDCLFDEKHFWGDYPIPSISKSDPHFETAGGYWMGPVWMSYPIDILRGLSWHDKTAAGKLLDRLLNMMLPEGQPAVYENYHPLTGQPMECPNFSWNGQIIDIIMRDMFGISFDGAKVSATSAGVPPDWDSWKVKSVVLHGKRFNISAKKCRGQWQYEIKEK